MIIVEAITEIGPEKTLSIGLPADVEPGLHRVVITLEEKALEPSLTGPQTLNLRKLHVPGWPADSNFSRSDIYGDDER
jgi:hypothetical protein